MLYRVIDLKYSKIQGGIDDEPLQRLLHGHEVLSRGERLYFHDGVAHLLVALVHESNSGGSPTTAENFVRLPPGEILAFRDPPSD